jgi:Cdc6-like AAA superfamily ATPase
MRDRYWHIQMFLPEGKGGTVINSIEMLEEDEPVIGTGEWEDLQCDHFKGENNGIQIGDIVMVREGNRPLALCEVTSDCFEDEELEKKHINKLYRNVKVLDWNTTDKISSLFTQGTLKILYKSSNTPSWNYINNWYKKVIDNMEIHKLIDVLNAKHQIILQGAPGTGKTYTAKDVAEQLIFDEISSDKQTQAERLKNSPQYKLIQFHPAYSYEDFVRGIIVENTDGNIEYITKNKILIDFSEKALKNFEDSKKEPEILKKERQNKDLLENFKANIIDKAEDEKIEIENTKASIHEINDHGFRFSMPKNRGRHGLNYQTILSLMNYPNSEIKEINFKIKQPYYQAIIKMIRKEDEKIEKDEDTQSKILSQNYVLIIDEINRANLPAVLGELIYALEYRGENVESMYAIDGDNSLILPPNLYIIGTMNTADRSVGQIDYAIRRRFAFVDMLPQILDIDGFDISLFEQVSKLFISNFEEYKHDNKIIFEKSDFLSEEFRPEDVWLGHSYFIMKDKDGKDIRDMRLNYEIKPILREYLKDGIFKSNAKNEINNLK